MCDANVPTQLCDYGLVVYTAKIQSLLAQGVN